MLLADSIISTAKRFREMKKLQFLKAGMESGVSPAQFISINFEDLNYAYLQTAKALHNEITKRAREGYNHQETFSGTELTEII